MPLSVIVPARNSRQTLPQTLESLTRSTLSSEHFEVLIVDDGSTDDTLAWLEAQVGQVPFALGWTRRERGGPAAARNLGAGCAHHEVLLFLDGDMIAEPAALESHLALHEHHARALVSGILRPWPPACTSTFARIVYLDQPASNELPGWAPSFQDAFTSNMSIRRREFDLLGGFDEGLHAFEDIDLAYRAQGAGLQLLFAPGAIGYHNDPQTLDGVCRRERRYQAQAVAFLRKHPELQGQIRYLADKGPIEWGRDPSPLVLRKVARRLIAGRGPLALLQAAIRILERTYPHPRLLRFLYWKVVASYQLIGFREGLRAAAAQAGIRNRLPRASERGTYPGESHDP